MDTALGHLGEEVKEKYKAKNIDILSIGGSLTSLLQFNDTHINKSLKDRMRDFWETWPTESEEEYIRTEKRKKASYEMIAKWLHDSWNSLAADDFIMKGFKECGYYALHSNLADTLKNGEVNQELCNEVGELQVKFFSIIYTLDFSSPPPPPLYIGKIIRACPHI